MPRKILIRSSDFPYHITNRSNNREFFYLPPNELWPIFLDCLTELKIQFHCEIHAFVLMSNHYHLLISTPLENIGEAMKYLHREIARKANRQTRRINHFFGGRYKWSLIDDENYYWNSIKYIFRNPVRAGICHKVEEFQFSSLNTPAENFEWLVTDIFHNKTQKIELDLDWLNETFKTGEEQLIRKALRRREFKLTRNDDGYSMILDSPLSKKGTVT